jgi:outer membrane protein insertion porin family
MPLSQRFSMGGADTLRGYKDDQFRGNSMLRGTVEYRIPIVKKVQGVLFVDSGYAWDKRYDEKNFDLGLDQGWLRHRHAYQLAFRTD